MSSVLAEICDKKRAHVAKQKQAVSLDALKEQIKSAPAPKGFIQTLENAAFPAIIAEVKKASPSKGVIRDDFNPQEIATIYRDNGAACLSVLTDEPYFQGSDDIFRSVRQTVDMPLLRKDFMVDPYQIYESRALGADCILLIMAALNDDEYESLYALSTDLGMDVLVETHNKDELDRANRISPKMVGVNNRNLKTLNVDVQTSIDLAEHMPQNALTVAESGLKDHETLLALQQHGYNTFLIGESLMRQNDIATALKTMRNKK